MREWEQMSWKAGRSQLEVIRRVGHLVAERAHRMLRKGESVVALYGRGNNGQDVLQACRLFVEHEVHRVEAIHPRQSLAEFESILSLKPSLLLDGVFGTGLNRRLDPEFCRLFEAVNRSGIPILSVDLPSGLDGETGEPAGAALKAQVTLTLGAPKRGLLESRAWPFVGRLEVAPQIGLIDCPFSSELQWTLPSDFRWFPPARPVEGHKGTFGNLAIVAGSLGCHGAAVLAARGAQRAQTGLITVITSPEVYQPVASHLQSVMVQPWGEEPSLPARCTAVLIGPGLADPAVEPKARRWVEGLWRSSPLPVIVDASAIAWLPKGATPEGVLRVVTPHPGEAARLVGGSSEEVLSRRFDVVREISRNYGDCWVVLKGCQTLVGRSRGPIHVNCSGNPAMGQGGSGDLLAGWLSGLVAQPALAADVARTLRYAVWKHGAVADDLERHRPHWTIEDLAAWPTFAEPDAGNRPVVVPEFGA